jgi:hypothetical protein
VRKSRLWHRVQISGERGREQPTPIGSAPEPHCPSKKPLSLGHFYDPTYEVTVARSARQAPRATGGDVTPFMGDEIASSIELSRDDVHDHARSFRSTQLRRAGHRGPHDALPQIRKSSLRAQIVPPPFRDALLPPPSTWAPRHPTALDTTSRPLVRRRARSLQPSSLAASARSSATSEGYARGRHGRRNGLHDACGSARVPGHHETRL